MSDCPSLTACPFFHDQMDDMPAMAEMLKKHHCRGDNASCARWMVSSKLGKGKVPSNLFPNQTARAAELVGAG